MPNTRKALISLKEIKRQIDELTLQVNVGEFYTVNVDVGDYWTACEDLDAWSKGTLKRRTLNSLTADMRTLSLTQKVDKPTLQRIQWNLAAIIDWLGTLEAQAV